MRVTLTGMLAVATVVSVLVLMASVWLQVLIFEARDDTQRLSFLTTTKDLWVGNIGVVPVLLLVFLLAIAVALYSLVQREARIGWVQLERSFNVFLTRLSAFFADITLRLDDFSRLAQFFLPEKTRKAANASLHTNVPAKSTSPSV